MWRKIVDHLQESRIYKRPTQPYVELKRQSINLMTRLQIFRPFKLRLTADYDRDEIDSVIHHPRFRSQNPLHCEIDSDRNVAASLCFNIPYFQRMKYVNKYLSGPMKTTLSLYAKEMKALTGSLSIDYNEKIGLSTSFHPRSFGINYFGKNHGFEFMYCSLETVNKSQEMAPSLCYLFNKFIDPAEVTVLANIYGNVCTVVSTYYKKSRFSTFSEINTWTLTSNAGFGYAVLFYDSSLSVSYDYNANSVNFEMSLNKFDDEYKHGITAFAPISLGFFSGKK